MFIPLLFGIVYMSDWIDNKTDCSGEAFQKRVSDRPHSVRAPSFWDDLFRQTKHEKEKWNSYSKKGIMAFLWSFL